MRRQLDDFAADVRDLFVGERTFGDALIPPVAFVVLQRFVGIAGAAGIAIGIAALFGLWRFRVRGSLAYAAGGVASVAFAAGLAIRSGDAEDFFLPGIVAAFGWAAAGVVSVLVRRPFLAFGSAFLRGWPLDWYWRDDVRPAYAAMSLLWAGFLALRGLGQLWLFLDERTEALLTFKLVTGWPVGLPLMFVTYVWGNRRLQTLGGPSVEEFDAGADPPFTGGQHGF